MLVIVVTGGIGSGKSTATRHFGEKGAAILDLDDILHGLLAPGRREHDEIVAAFGEGVLDAEGVVDRSALASVAFASPDSCARSRSA